MQIAVIGLGRFGAKVAEVAASRGADVLGIDSKMDICEAMKDRVSQVVALNSTDEKAMRAVGVQDVDVAIVAIGTDVQSAIMTTSILHRMGVNRIIARAIQSLEGDILKEVGATEVLFLEDYMGTQIALRIISPHIVDRMPLGPDYILAHVSPLPEFVGKTLSEINPRATYGLNVIAIRRRVPALTEEGESTFQFDVNDAPGPDDRVEKDDVLVVIGTTTKVDGFLQLPEGRP